jgi:hypothetical protein
MNPDSGLGKIFAVAAERQSTRVAMVHTAAFVGLFEAANATGILHTGGHGSILAWSIGFGILTKALEGLMIVNGVKAQNGTPARPEQNPGRHIKAAFNVVSDAIKDPASTKAIMPNAIFGAILGGLLFTPAYEPVAMATAAASFGAFTGVGAKVVTGLSNAMDKRYGYQPAIPRGY